ncbi:Ribonuclease BN-like family protein [Nocardioides dokdonensis FR1436]|uniref:Ribonuclease BN-like family protein n=1 Tax=Nocardioides dokdonensis FR1436 TaxID=1300347 RepID=A0A1A9GIT6_9ACTN|nr:Ribonuclease BN-like family protein [Nocardioides dokdonensis FR1436]
MPIAVFYKYIDDQGPYLAAIITYYGFIAIFPLLLLATSILGFLLQGNPGLQEAVLSSALRQFPIIGEELGRPEGMSGSTTAVVVGALTATYGALGLGQALQNAQNIAWSVPRNSRPNPVVLRIKSLVLLVTSGLAVLGISVFSALGSETDMLVVSVDGSWRWVVRLVTVLLVGAVLTALFRLAAARRLSVSQAAPGAYVVAVLWQGLQWLGTLYVTAVLSGTDGMNGTFALVLGLIGLIYIAAVMGVIGMEVNVVLARQLYPRSLLTLFLDKVDLTPADKRAYTYYVRSQRHKVNEVIDVHFTEHEVPETEPEAEPEPQELRRQPPTTTLDLRGPSAAAPPAPPPSRD